MHTPSLHGMTLPTGLKGEDFTYLHEMIVTQELVRAGGRGFSDGFQGTSALDAQGVC